MIIGMPPGSTRDGVGELRVSDARLDVGDAIFQIDLENAIHAGGGDDDAVLERDASAGQAGAGAAGNDRDIQFRQELDDG